MNNLLQLKGRFEQKVAPVGFGPIELPANTTIKSEDIETLIVSIKAVNEYWENKTILNNALVSIYYKDVVAKSRRVNHIFKTSKMKSNQSIVGARFSEEENAKHIITHCVGRWMINDTIQKLSVTKDALDKYFGGEITTAIIKDINDKKITYNNEIMSHAKFASLLKDVCSIEKFGVYEYEENGGEGDSLVTVFDTYQNIVDVLNTIGLNISNPLVLNNTTIRLNKNEFDVLRLKAPYLISMAVSDLAKLDYEDFPISSTDKLTIPEPQNEPIIGVIDTLFDENVYFSKWVEYENLIEPSISVTVRDYEHGTAVSSLIVDGPSFNPRLEDGCGRFKVKHFAVATSGKSSTTSILKAIEIAVASNRNIKVWNLSLGSALEINRNFISPEAAILDRLQFENDVIFIVAGTNKPTSVNSLKIGAPADSINSLVVNSVKRSHEKASYSRKGPVLDFFTKPDISYYGGDNNEKITVCLPNGLGELMGTSFAAPWITRKMAYLIYILGLSREVAKALIIHSATGWQKIKDKEYVGQGIVPMHISDVVQTRPDEIRFYITGVSEKYNTYNYNLPVPVVDGKHPFKAKATMCYFPNCSRNQGVDYTNTEMNLTLGRINKDAINSINKNNQDESCYGFYYEGEARKFFKKWDNVKHIQEKFTEKAVKSYETGNWGIRVTTKERLEKRDGEDLLFGIIVTLKEVSGKNRYDSFVSLCQLRGWLVNEVDIKERVDIHALAENEIIFD